MFMCTLYALFESVVVSWKKLFLLFYCEQSLCSRNVEPDRDWSTQHLYEGEREREKREREEREKRRERGVRLKRVIASEVELRDWNIRLTVYKSMACVYCFFLSLSPYSRQQVGVTLMDPLSARRETRTPPTSHICVLSPFFSSDRMFAP